MRLSVLILFAILGVMSSDCFGQDASDVELPSVLQVEEDASGGLIFNRDKDAAPLPLLDPDRKRILDGSRFESWGKSLCWAAFGILCVVGSLCIAFLAFTWARKAVTGV